MVVFIAMTVVGFAVSVTGPAIRADVGMSDKYWCTDVCGVYAPVSTKMTLIVSVIQSICASKKRCLQKS